MRARGCQERAFGASHFLENRVTSFGEAAVAGDMTRLQRFAHVVELAAGHGGAIEPDRPGHRRPSFTAARVSRSISRRLIVSRLSCTCLPRASATATFTLPFLKYMRVGTIVRPRSTVLPMSFLISALRSSSLRRRF